MLVVVVNTLIDTTNLDNTENGNFKLEVLKYNLVRPGNIKTNNIFCV